MNTKRQEWRAKMRAAVRPREKAERALRLVEQSIATLKDQVHGGRIRSASVESFWTRRLTGRTTIPRAQA